MYKEIPSNIGDYLNYDSLTGDLTWVKKTATKGRAKIGDIVKTVNKWGYLQVSVNKSRMYAHRIAWFLHTSEQPNFEIDHIDGNKLNNAFNNLRLSTRSENECNKQKQKNNSSGYKGVSFFASRNKWRARICVNNVTKYLGYFDTPEEAHLAYCTAADKYHKEFSNYG